MIEVKAMFTEKSDALRIIEQAQEAEQKHLDYFQDGYTEGFSDGWDKAIENVKVILKKYSIGGEKSELKPATKFVRESSLAEQIAKIHSEYLEVMSAVIHNEGKARIAEELVDVQQACETAMAILGMNEEERRKTREKVLQKNARRGYYNGGNYAG
jgi:hypothetical protein